MKEKAVNITNIIGGIAGVSGVVCFYLSYYEWLMALAIISIISSVINVLWGNQNSLITEILAGAIGVIVALIGKHDVFTYILVALCFESGILFIISAIVATPVALAVFLKRTMVSASSTKKTKKREISIYTRDFLHALKITLIMAVAIAVIIGVFWFSSSGAALGVLSIFLIDAFTAIFPGLVLSIVFVIGMRVTRKRGVGGAGAWWAAGLILGGIYSFGNIMSDHPNYPSVIVCAVVVVIFYFPMCKKGNRNDKN